MRMNFIWIKLSSVIFLHYHGIAAEDTHFDVLKISNVPFPKSGWREFPARINATFHKEIAEYTVCHRFLIDSFNDDLFYTMAAAADDLFSYFYVLDRMSFDYPGADGYPGGLWSGKRNIPGGGLGNRGFPAYHSYIVARTIQISKETYFKPLQTKSNC